MNTTRPEIRLLADAEAVGRAAADEFVRLTQQAVRARGQFTVALSGGSTPRRLYQLLAEPPWSPRIDWSRVEVFWGDERAVPPDHADSNYRMAREALLSRVPIPEDHIHRMAAERPDREKAACEYREEIARVLGVPVDGPPPAFDLILLGMGPDGHTASLFPHTAALKDRVRWVAVNHVAKLDADRLTLTVQVLNRAARVLFLVAGADKAAVLAEVLEGPADPERLPSQLVRPDPGRVLWLVDRAAAVHLKQLMG